MQSFVNFESSCQNISSVVYSSSSLKLHCSDLLAVSGAYRIFISLSLFHCFLFFLTLGVNSNVSCRARIHNGFWGWKIIFLFILIFLSFLVETTPSVEMVLMIIGMVGASFYIFVQLFSLSDFAANWALSWEAAAAKNGPHWTCLIWLG